MVDEETTETTTPSEEAPVESADAPTEKVPQPEESGETETGESDANVA